MERFFLEVQLPPPVTYFDFDLQRFDVTVWTLTKDGSNLTLSDGTNTYTGTAASVIANAVAGKANDSADADTSKTLLAGGDTIQLGGESTEFNIGDNCLIFNSGIELTLDLNGKTLKSTKTADASGAVVLGALTNSYRDTVIKNKLTIVGNGTIEGSKNGVYLLGPQATNTDLTDHTKYTQLIVGNGATGDTINIKGSSGSGIAGNGSANYSDITINNNAEGIIEGTRAGIYNSQVGKLTINSGTIKGTDKTNGSGIEIRAGELEVNGGTISAGSGSTGVQFNPSGNGSTTKGAGIAVAQHNTQKAITVNIKGGTVSGYTALAATNPQTIAASNLEACDRESNSNAGFVDYFGEAVTDNPTVKVTYSGTEYDVLALVDTSTGYFSSNLKPRASYYIKVDESYYKVTKSSSGEGTFTVGDSVSNPVKEGYELKSLAQRAIGTITVNVTGGTLESTSTATANTIGKSGNTYTVVGKDAIVNTDSRVEIAISNATIKGALAASQQSRTNDKNGFTLGEGNTYSNFSGDTSNLFPYYYATESGTNVIDLAILGTEGWNKSAIDNNWAYVIEPEGTASIGTALAQLVADSVNAVFSLTSGGNTESKIMAFDATSNMFNDLSYKDGETTKYYTKIDANQVNANTSFDFTGNDRITEIKGGAGNDTLKPGDVESITLGGGSGADVFIFNGNNETITDFGTGADSINMPSSFRPANAEFTAANDKISLDFDGNVLAFENLGENEVSLSGGHVFATKFHSVDKQSITFTSVQSAAYNGSESNFATIDAAAAGASISITGNELDNRIVGSNKGGTLNGGDGDDKFYVTDRENTAKYLFEHTAGSKELVEGFDDRNDTLSVAAAADITEAKSSRSKLIFTVGKNDDITLKGDDIEKVSLQGGGFLTKDGHVSDANFRLFTNAKGKIDLTDLPYEGSGVTSIDATAATKSSVTLTANNAVTNVNLAANKKKDQFEYAGGTVSITGYESGKDKLNIEEAGAITSFGLINDNDVAISVGGATNVISLQGAKDQEVLIHDGNSRGNSYSKFVFHANGVLYNKAKRPTEATISTGAGNYTADNTVKKVFAIGLGEAISITSGNVKSTLDASEAGVGVSLIGGAKNNKFVGSTGADLFVYNGGKDNVQDFDTNDKISFGDESFDMSGAKITASNKSLKFKFTSKNTLTLKSDGKISSASIDGGEYTFSKNAYSTGSGTVSLTSQFSGTYKVGKDSNATDIYGANVKKNLTFKGTSATESLVGGTKKTNFKGGGGNDIFVGNASAKDTFFYAKTDSGDKTIQGFDFSTSSKDKIKIASGTITGISKSGNDIDFTTKGGSLTLKNEDNTNVLIKANNTHYWFATENGDGYSSGELITADTKVTRAQANATGYAIVDLGYSTNLVKTEVAVKAGEFTFDSSGIHKTTT